MITVRIGLHLVLLPLLILNGRKFRAVEVVAFPFPLISTCLGKKKKKKTERVKTWIRLARMTATKRNSLRACPHYQCSRTRVSPHAGRFETSLGKVRESGTNNGTPCRPLIAPRSPKPHNSSRAKESSYQSTDNERLFVGLKKKKIINRLDRSVT